MKIDLGHLTADSRDIKITNTESLDAPVYRRGRDTRNERRVDIGPITFTCGRYDLDHLLRRLLYDNSQWGRRSGDTGVTLPDPLDFASAKHGGGEWRWVVDGSFPEYSDRRANEVTGGGADGTHADKGTALLAAVISTFIHEAREATKLNGERVSTPHFKDPERDEASLELEERIALDAAVRLVNFDVSAH
jgi:hypothetical protein